MQVPAMLRSLLTLLLLGTATAAAQAAGWYLFARDDGCIDVDAVARREKLPRSPASPEDFANLMRERGETVVVGAPAGVSPELAGKLVQVQYGRGKALLFMKDEVCRNVEFGRK